MTSRPQVSVVTPCYNVESYLSEFHRFMESFLAQTLEDIELIAIENGSTDGTAALLDEYATRDARIRVIRLKENVGHNGGCNAGIPHVLGKYTFFADCDDYLYPELCENTCRRAEETGADVVVFYPDLSDWGWNGANSINTSVVRGVDLEKPIRGTDKFVFLATFLPPWNKLLRTSLLLGANIHFPSRPFFDDHFFSWQTILEADSVAILPQTLYKWNLRSSSVTHEGSGHQLLNSFHVWKEMEDYLLTFRYGETWIPYYYAYKYRQISYDYFKLRDGFFKTKDEAVIAEYRRRVIANLDAEDVCRIESEEIDAIYPPDLWLVHKEHKSLMTEFVREWKKENAAVFERVLRETPDVSIVVSCYNAEKYLDDFHECFESMRNQTLHNIEIIAVDNGSEDRTGELLADYAKKDSRFRVVTLEENVGYGPGRNAGIPYARGKYVFFSDSDDLLHPELCEKTFRRAEETDSEVVVFYPDLTDYDVDGSLAISATVPDGGPLGETAESIDKFAFITSLLAPWNKLCRTDLIRRANIHFPEYYFDDHYFSWKLVLEAERMTPLREFLYKWKRRSDSVSNHDDGRRYSCIFKIAEMIATSIYDRDDCERWKPLFAYYKFRLICNAYKSLSEQGDPGIQRAFIERFIDSFETDEMIGNPERIKNLIAQSCDGLLEALIDEFENRGVLPGDTPPSVEENRPLLSIVMPCYNIEGYLSYFTKSLHSALDQTQRNIEVVAVDNGSADRTGEILRKYAKDDPRLKIVSLPENVGHGPGRNEGLRHAKGEYVFFADSDDCLHPRLAEWTCAKARETEADVVVFYPDLSEWGWNDKLAFLETLPSGKPLGDYVEGTDKYTFLTHYHAQWNKVCRRDFLLRQNICFASTYLDDHLFSWDVIVKAGRVAPLRETLYRWRKRNASVSHTGVRTKQIFATFEVHRKMEEMLFQRNDGDQWKRFYYGYRFQQLHNGEMYLSDFGLRREFRAELQKSINARDVKRLIKGEYYHHHLSDPCKAYCYEVLSQWMQENGCYAEILD